MTDETDKGANEIEDVASGNSGHLEKPASGPASIAIDHTSTGMTKDPPISTTSDKNNNDEKKVSKNQMKKKRKWEKAMEVKRRRKDQQKKVKIAMAEAEGRDIDAEKEDMERRRKDGSGWARRNEFWKEIFRKTSSKYQVYLDCSFEQEMSKSEINSLASQIRYCYASNKKAKHPVKTTACSLGGKTLDILNNVSGLDQWANREFHITDKDILETTKDKSKLIYLTSDSDNTLADLEDDKIYIIGGIVDRNRLKRVAIDRAETFGIQTAKLPITDYLNMVSTKVLTCNHVFDILLKWRENNGDWKKALLDVLPKKKEAKEKES
jgi:tRNA (guanine9-N1)-methyltransferase